MEAIWNSNLVTAERSAPSSVKGADRTEVYLRVQAAGAIVGAVMKATKGQADAARVRELVVAACS
jgi:Asp-tRNA(Asn)/Glu-tRNA(Gln) amidotransferase B subunit